MQVRTQPFVVAPCPRGLRPTGWKSYYGMLCCSNWMGEESWVSVWERCQSRIARNLSSCWSARVVAVYKTNNGRRTPCADHTVFNYYLTIVSKWLFKIANVFIYDVLTYNDILIYDFITYLDIFMYTLTKKCNINFKGDI